MLAITAGRSCLDVASQICSRFYFFTSYRRITITSFCTLIGITIIRTILSYTSTIRTFLIAGAIVCALTARSITVVTACTECLTRTTTCYGVAVATCTAALTYTLTARSTTVILRAVSVPRRTVVPKASVKINLL